MTTFQDILTAAQALPPDQRAQLLVALWDNLGPENWIPPDESWMAEITRRSDLVESREMGTAAWSEVRKQVRRDTGLDD